MTRIRLAVMFAVSLLSCSKGHQFTSQGVTAAQEAAQEATKVKPTVQLRVSAKGENVQEGRPIQVKPGEVVQLRVEVIHANGTSSDVTNSPNTNYFAETPGSVAVATGGRVTIASNATNGGKVISVGIIYGKPGDVEIGATSVIFKVEAPKAPEQALVVTASSTNLGIGESAKLKVISKLADGETQDVTTNPSTAYLTTSEYRLIPEAMGRVTCVGTDHGASDTAILNVHYGNTSDQLEFELHQGGPGPTLKIEVEKDVLQEGERSKFVVRSLKDGRVLTSRSLGTSYLVFGGKGIAEPDLLAIDDAGGTITAINALGKYQRRSPLLFVRNGDLVGWTVLKIVHSSGRTMTMQH